MSSLIASPGSVNCRWSCFISLGRESGVNVIKVAPAMTVKFMTYEQVCLILELCLKL